MTAKALFTEIGADSMARLKLTPENVKGHTDAEWLLVELLALRREVGTVYTTHVTYAGQDYTMATTSKDIHQGIGAMTAQGRKYLCALFHAELDAIEQAGLIFLPPMGDDHQKQRAMHVLRAHAEGSDVVIFMLSPAG